MLPVLAEREAVARVGTPTGPAPTRPTKSDQKWPSYPARRRARDRPAGRTPGMRRAGGGAVAPP